MTYSRKWGHSVVRTQLLVFEQRRRAELYAKHSEAQGNPNLKEASEEAYRKGVPTRRAEQIKLIS